MEDKKDIMKPKLIYIPTRIILPCEGKLRMMLNSSVAYSLYIPCVHELEFVLPTG